MITVSPMCKSANNLKVVFHVFVSFITLYYYSFEVHLHLRAPGDFKNTYQLIIAFVQCHFFF